MPAGAGILPPFYAIATLTAARIESNPIPAISQRMVSRMFRLPEAWSLAPCPAACRSPARRRQLAAKGAQEHTRQCDQTAFNLKPA
jgi:hypothetical protein